MIRPRPGGFHPIDVKGRPYAFVQQSEEHDGGMLMKRIPSARVEEGRRRVWNKERSRFEEEPPGLEIEGQPGRWYTVMGSIPHPAEGRTLLDEAEFWAYAAELDDEGWEAVKAAGWGTA